jgi:hypothetical protein
VTATVGALRAQFNPRDPVPVNGKPIPRLERLGLQLAWSAALAFFAQLIIMTAYFFITQVRYPGHIAGQPVWMKPYWDRLLDAQLSAAKWTLSRHLWRNLLDPILATLFVKSLMANWKKDPDSRCSMWYLALSPLLILVAATVLIAGVAWLVYWGVPWIPAHVPALVIQLVAGILIGLVIHRIYAPAGRTVQGYFVDRQVWKARRQPSRGQPHGYWAKVEYAPPRWFPPVVQELYWHKLDNEIPVEQPGIWPRLVIPPFAVLVFAMIVFGGIIKFGIAPGRLHWFNV